MDSQEYIFVFSEEQKINTVAIKGVFPDFVIVAYNDEEEFAEIVDGNIKMKPGKILAVKTTADTASEVAFIYGLVKVNPYVYTCKKFYTEGV